MDVWNSPRKNVRYSLDSDLLMDVPRFPGRLYNGMDIDGLRKGAPP